MRGGRTAPALIAPAQAALEEEGARKLRARHLAPEYPKSPRHGDRVAGPNKQTSWPVSVCCFEQRKAGNGRVRVTFWTHFSGAATWGPRRGYKCRADYYTVQHLGYYGIYGMWGTYCHVFRVSRLLVRVFKEASI